MVTLAAQSLAAPIYLDGTKVRLEFTGDATVGAMFTQLRHKEGGNLDIQPYYVNTVFMPELNGRSWEIDGTLRGSTPNPGGAETLGSAFTVHPGLATSFAAYDATAAYGVFKAYLFEWRGVVVTGAPDADRLWVRQLWFLQNNTDSYGKVLTWVGRERGSSFSIEHVRSPLLWIKGFTAPRGAENHLEGTKRQRVLVPHLSFNAVGTYSQNSNFYQWCFNSLNRSLTHPGTHTMQFVAMESGDNLDAATYKRTLYFQTEDTEGWLKKFWYRGLTAGTEGFFRLSQSYMPPFAKNLGRLIEDGRPNESEFGNSCNPPYAVQIGALTSATDDWWYDACALYRTWLEGSGMLPPKVPSNPALSTFNSNPHYWLGCITVDPGALATPTYGAFVAQFKAQIAALSNTHFTLQNAWLHLQTWKYAFATASVAGQSDPEFRAAVTDIIHALGHYVSVYSLPVNQSAWSNYGISMPSSARITSRAGVQDSDPGFDISETAAHPVFNERMRKLLNDLQLDGLYDDVLVGLGAISQYAPGGPSHVRHGGKDFTRGKVAFLQAQRAMLRDNGSSADQAGRELMLSETQEEFCVGLLDLGQDGYHWHPWHTALAEWIVWDGTGLLPDLTLDDYPRAQRNMAPPIWNAVYHEYAPSKHFSVMPTNAGLKTNTFFHSGPFAAMTATQLNDLHCCMRAGSFVSGMSPGFFDYNASFVQSELIKLDANGVVVVGDAAYDPSSCGITIWNFYKTLFQSQLYSYAGQFLLYGKMLRPLVVDYSAAAVARQNNPAAVCRDTNPAGFFAIYPYFYYDTSDPTFASPGIPWGTLTGYDVTRVLHGMWQSQEGVVGLVLVNWSNSNASWIGTFDPALYGLVGSVNVTRLNIGAAGTALGATAVAATIGTTGSGATIDIGVLGARTLTVITFTV